MLETQISDCVKTSGCTFGSVMITGHMDICHVIYDQPAPEVHVCVTMFVITSFRTYTVADVIYGNIAL